MEWLPVSIGSFPARTHGFLSKLAFSNPLNSAVYELAYSTYLSGTNAAANAVT